MRKETNGQELSANIQELGIWRVPGHSVDSPSGAGLAVSRRENMKLDPCLITCLSIILDESDENEHGKM